jgi:beta-xylosidase
MATVDEAGERHLIWKEDGNSRGQPTVLWAQRLSEDGLKLVGKPTEILRNDAGWEGEVVEGPFVLKQADTFYLFYSGNGCCGSGCRYALGVARSKSLLGPWEKNPDNPILGGNSEWRCPGHGSIVSFDLGRYYLLYHAYNFTAALPNGRQGMLDEVVFNEAGWPSIRERKGPSSESRSPGGTVQRRAAGTFFDDFQDKTLRPGWQWPQDREPRIELSSSKLGQLVLRPGPDPVSELASAVLARPSVLPDFQATAVVDATTMRPGTFAGIAAYGDSTHVIGLALGTQVIRLWRRDSGDPVTLAELPAPAVKKVYLRLISEGGRTFHFGVSVDGRQWKQVGAPAGGEPGRMWQMPVHVALTAGGKDPAVEARFESLKLEPFRKR